MDGLHTSEESDKPKETNDLINESVQQASFKETYSLPSPQDAVTNDETSPSTTNLTRIRWRILCACLLLAETQAALENTITANLQPVIIDTFGEISKFPWINITYSLGGAATCLLW